MSSRSIRCTYLLRNVTHVHSKSRGMHVASKDQRKFFDELGYRLGIRELDDWYPILTGKTLRDYGGANILKDYKTASAALTASYPEHKWIPWKFELAPKGFWKSKENQRTFFDWLGKQLGVKELDDWYKVLNLKTLRQYHGGTLIATYYNGSAFAALKACYPEHNWIPWKFETTTLGFWKSVENQRNFFDWLGKQLGVKALDDWYSLLSTKTVALHGGDSFIHVYYHGSAIEALRAAYPEHNWIIWKFKSCPKGFWKSIENQRAFFNWLGNELGVKQLDDWYSVLSTDAVFRNGGSWIRHCYNSSAIEALKASYPEHNWIPWKFNFSTHRMLMSPQLAAAFVVYFTEKLGINTLDDWYRVDSTQLLHLGATQNFIKKQGGLYNILKQQYPEHPWDPKKFRGGKKGQRWLLVCLQKLYPNCTVVEDYMYPNAFFEKSRRPIQLDAFIPSLSLAFEYQGQQHFRDVPMFQPQRVYQKRDDEKRALCESRNVKLVEVPYWWNRSLKELQQFINETK